MTPNRFLIVLTANLLWAMPGLCRGSETLITYQVAGVFVEKLFAEDPPVLKLGDPFQVSYTFELPSTETVYGQGLSRHVFKAAHVSGTLGSLEYATKSSSVYLWEPPSSDDTLVLESDYDGLTVRVVLASSDPNAVNQSIVPTALSLSQFDLRRELQVFGARGISIVGRIDSLAVVPEPSVLGLAVMGIGALCVFRRPRRTA